MSTNHHPVNICINGYTFKEVYNERVDSWVCNVYSGNKLIGTYNSLREAQYYFSELCMWKEDPKCSQSYF